ncbi:MAG: hypothetical protein EAX96_05060 [Candidatus Lokiarchaeota archaeon]|nr:hypothetical protein [Candidatus Lokiarchaeota archaeon]
MDYNVILIRYGEIGLKSNQVRKRIEQILKKNIHFKLKKKINEFQIKILPARGRIYIYTDEIKKASKFLTKVFGISSFSPAIECTSELKNIEETVLKLAENIIKPGDTFAIRTRRSGTHKYSSKEIAERMGAVILNRFGRNQIKVDLKNPKKTLFIEVRDKLAHIFEKKINGLGGFPYYSQNKVISLISNECSLISTWLILRKGCEITPVFILDQGLNKKAKNLIQEFINSLKKYLPIEKWLTYFIDIHEFLNEENQKLVIKNALRYIIEKEEALGLVTSEIELDNLEIQEDIGVPIYRPLLFLSHEQLIKFESIIPLNIKLIAPMIPKYEKNKRQEIPKSELIDEIDLQKIIFEKKI